jgi:hypothetical protein
MDGKILSRILMGGKIEGGNLYGREKEEKESYERE